jgi:hypothetical protein
MRFLLQAQMTAIRRPGIVADPAEGFEAAAESPGDGRREPGVRVFEAAREQILLGGAMQREQASVAFARLLFGRIFLRRLPFPVAVLRARSRVHQQIQLAGEPRERSHGHRAGVVFDNKLRNEERVIEIRERVIEALARVDAAQRVQISRRVFTDEH